MKNLILKYSVTFPAILFAAGLLTFSTMQSVAQEEPTEQEEADDSGMRPTRDHFESSWIIDNQTTLLKQKGTFEFMIQHRFGSVSNGLTDLYGLYAPSNIRLGFNYTLLDSFGFGIFKGPLAIGFGTTKDNRIQDFNLKYALLRQTRNGKIPVSVTYYVNTGLETGKKLDDLPNGNYSDRLSYFHQIIISRRFGSKLSLQVAPSVSHYNVVEPLMYNDHFAVAVSGRFKVTSSMAVIVNADQPLTKHKLYNPQPNVGFGIEMATSSHSFQIFATNYTSIVQQRNNVYNQNDPWNKGYVIGFNINRLWNF